MRRFIVAMLISGAMVAFGAVGAIAANPPGTGKPGQSCQELEPNVPGHANESPGSPFNEEGIDSAEGGIGGQHYNENSQYDVACFQQAEKH
ncbi:MAG: hypothetical protein E6G34_05795 [Actinobacteria bacterium]|nr:MAG: hypothetical protein E6G34_05795 [Actinomycetota bacterium]